LGLFGGFLEELAGRGNFKEVGWLLRVKDFSQLGSGESFLAKKTQISFFGFELFGAIF